MSATSPRRTPSPATSTRARSRRWRPSRAPRTVVISAAIEAEVAQLPDAEEHEFLEAIGLHEPGLDRLIRAGYALLDLITYFTAGPKEARAWTVHKGAKAPQAAGVIHTDFERGFIRAQTIAYDDFVALGGEVAAKEAGKARDEGKEYVVAGRRRDAVQVQHLSFKGIRCRFLAASRLRSQSRSCEAVNDDRASARPAPCRRHPGVL